MNNLSIILPILSFLVIYYFFKKIHFLNENINYSKHKNFGKNNKSPLIIGGLYLTIIIIFFLPNDLNLLKISILLIFFLGILSDKNILPSPKIRFLIQILILFNLVFFAELKIINLENQILNEILANKIFNSIFTVFCLAILINGSNFLDGLNGLLSGYYLMVFLSIFYVGFNYDDVSLLFLSEMKIIFFSLFIFFLFNLFGKVYLGDGGSYLIATIIGFYLIKISLINNQVSPYYIAAILWYPAFENLFSLIRRLLKKTKISSPDNKHLHQLIFLFIQSKKIINDKHTNYFSSLIILIINLPLFIFSNLLKEKKL